MKKIAIVHGSPRQNGNTRAITAVVLKKLKALGSEITEIDSTKLKFKVPGCIDCGKCKESKDYRCAIDDEVSEKVASLANYDVIVFSTPLYWWSYSAQLKIFIDRLYSLGKVNESYEFVSILNGKKLALIATAAGEMEDNLEVLEKQLKEPAEMLKCSFESCLFPLVKHKERSILLESDNIRKAENFAERILY